MRLNYRQSGEGDTILLLHGLLGSAMNWNRIARDLSASYRVINPDLRNHGSSPHAAQMDYPSMACDLFELLDSLSIERATLVGHSMGGKVAMQAALMEPERVSRLAVIDIAPVDYDQGHDSILEAMATLPLDQVRNRADADTALRPFIAEPGLRQFVLTNLVQQEGGFGWRVNLDVLRRCGGELRGFPSFVNQSAYPGAVLFIDAERSDYILPEYSDRIFERFPLAEIVEVLGAGHWVHAERPDEVVEVLKGFV